MPVRPTMEISPEDAAILLGATSAPDGSSGWLGVQVAQMLAAGDDRPRLRDLMEAGLIVYDPEDPTERWVTYLEVLAMIERDGVARLDCEDLGSLTAAEMRVSGPPWQPRTSPDFDPQARPYVYRSAPRVSHVIVMSPRFGYLDPSRTLGMLE